MKLVILDGYTENPGDLSWDWLGDTVDEYTVYDCTPQERVLERCRDADIVVTNKKLITGEIIEALPSLKFIATLSTGYNVVDVKAARERNIPVSNIPAYSTDGVAQLVFALLLEMTNAVAIHNESVKDGDWCRCEHFCYWKTPLTELRGKVFGIIGFGKIGSAVANIANAFGMKVIAYSPNTKSYDGFGEVEFTDKERVIRESDVISLHCPLTAETEAMVNTDFLKKMKSSAYLINTSRGPVIVEDDLAEALNTGVIAGAGLDVLTQEPADEKNPLLKCDNCIITPHIAWASLEARTRLMNIFEGNIKAFLEGKPRNVVN
ncbi:MAG: D-2-hydroxyacid dehydrogenase [Ruminococcaceae bacterium]|nr:D-2-hydroxyacid dehydrogenase [Oscillospiraceae bacterium]